MPVSAQNTDLEAYLGFDLGSASFSRLGFRRGAPSLCSASDMVAELFFLAAA